MYLKALTFAALLSIQTSFAGQINGGISGGGGEILPGKEVGKYTVESILRNAKLSAYYYFASTKMYNSNQYAPIFEIIKNTDISVNSTGPCYDDQNNEMDGSIYSNTPNTICISSYQLGKKLTNENAWAQTTALVIHEYSHLIGFNEEQADRLQRSALNSFNNGQLLQLRNTNYIFKYFYEEWRSFESIIPDLKKIQTSDDYQKLVNFMNLGAVLGLDEIYSSLMIESDHIFSVMSSHEHDYVQTLLAKIKVVQVGAGMMDKKKYNEIFGDNEEMEVEDFMKEYDSLGYQLGLKRFNYVRGVKVRKIPSMYKDHALYETEVLNALAEIKSGMKVVKESVQENYFSLLNLK